MSERPLFNAYIVIPVARPGGLLRGLCSALTFALPIYAAVAFGLYELVAWLS